MNIKLNEFRTGILKKPRRVLIKIGSSVLSDPVTVINFNAFAGLVDQIALLKSKGCEIVIVSSGAIAIGLRKLGIKQRPQNIPLKQAAAAVGQTGLMENYDRFFKEKNIKVAQVLLTDLILKNRSRFLNARNTLFTLLELGIIPIINENDSVVVDEIKLGDNDNLASITTNLIEADLLIILTDRDGLYETNPQKNKGSRLVPLVTKITRKVEGFADESTSSQGVGGMATKIASAKHATKYGIPVIIANGLAPNILDSIFQGDEVGTLFLPQKSKIPSRKHWIAYTLKPKGDLIIDDGAKEAILKKRKSLLPIGVVAIKGDFKFGDSVCIVDKKQKEIARGLANYSSSELKQILGISSKEIKRILGYRHYDEVVNRDDLVVL